jgi:hypothetical protein
MMTITLGWPVVALATFLIVIVWYAHRTPVQRKAVRQLVRELARLVSAWRS